MNKKFKRLLREYTEISVRYDADTASLWCYFNPKERPSYNITMMHEIRDLQLAIINYFESYDMKPETPIRYIILASQTIGVFNYGGDLNSFAELIEKNDRESLLYYAKLCVDILHLYYHNLNLPITTISLIEGSALGGGLETALASSVVIAEEEIKMGFPEIRFNLFPGMGAYSLLARSIGAKDAEEIISSGKIYSSQELYVKGAFDILAKPSEGKKALDEFIKKDSKRLNGMLAIRSARRIYHDVKHLELLEIAKVWVETALKLEEKDLRIMRKLVKTQNLKDTAMKLRTKQDRRVASNPLSYPFFNQDKMITHDRRSNDRRA